MVLGVIMRTTYWWITWPMIPGLQDMLYNLTAGLSRPVGNAVFALSHLTVEQSIQDAAPSYRTSISAPQFFICGTCDTQASDLCFIGHSTVGSGGINPCISQTGWAATHVPAHFGWAPQPVSMLWGREMMGIESQWIGHQTHKSITTATELSPLRFTENTGRRARTYFGTQKWTPWPCNAIGISAQWRYSLQLGTAKQFI